MAKLGTYLKETRGELKHVNWPTRREAIGFTALIVVISLFTAAYLGVFDFIFSRALQIFV